MGKDNTGSLGGGRCGQFRNVPQERIYEGFVNGSQLSKDSTS